MIERAVLQEKTSGWKRHLAMTAALTTVLAIEGCKKAPSNSLGKSIIEDYQGQSDDEARARFLLSKIKTAIHLKMTAKEPQWKGDHDEYLQAVGYVLNQHPDIRSEVARYFREFYAKIENTDNTIELAGLFARYADGGVSGRVMDQFEAMDSVSKENYRRDVLDELSAVDRLFDLGVVAKKAATTLPVK
jgi:hypothetical protein